MLHMLKIDIAHDSGEALLTVKRLRIKKKVEGISKKDTFFFYCFRLGALLYHGFLWVAEMEGNEQEMCQQYMCLPI